MARPLTIALLALLMSACATAKPPVPKDPNEFAVRLPRLAKDWTLRQHVVTLLGRPVAGLVLFNERAGSFIIIAFGRPEQGSPTQLAEAIRAAQVSTGGELGPIRTSRDGSRAEYEFSAPGSLIEGRKGIIVALTSKSRPDLRPVLQAVWPASRDAEMRPLFKRIVNGLRLK
jgi:hypothetical protein